VIALTLPPTELRWRCQECGKDVPEGQHEPQHVGFAMLMREESGFGAIEPLIGPPERGHRVYWTTGGRPGFMGGTTRHHRICGPVRLTEIDVQELFVEWMVGEMTR
jgi:hypothetical protein